MKLFKTYVRVLYRDKVTDRWVCGIYSHYDQDYKYHVLIGGLFIDDKDILPYKDNMHLLGTINEPTKETRIRIVYKPAKNMRDEVVRVTDVNAAIKDLSNDKNVAYYVIYND